MFSSIENIEKILAICLSICIIINAYYIKRYTKTWLVPGILFSLFWFLYTFPPLIFMYEVPINVFGVLFITINVILFSWTSAFFNWTQAFKHNDAKPASVEVFNTKKLKNSLKTSILVSIVCTILQVNAQGISINQIITEPLVSAGRYASKRYAGELNNSSFYIFSLLFSYLAVLIGGLVYGSSKKKWTLFCIIPSILVMFTQGAKGLFFLSIFLFLGGVLVTKFFDKQLNLFTVKAIKNAVKAFCLIFVMVIFSFMSRGMQNITNIQILYNKISYYLRSYAFTHLYAFSDWFTAYFNNGYASIKYDIRNNYLGYYTFRSISKNYAPDEILKIKGVYNEYFLYQDVLKSNIYTIYRGLIMDFGIIGTLIFIVINGLIIHFVFYVFLLRKTPVFSTAILIFTLGYFYISYIISLMTWNVIPVSFLLFCFVLALNRYKFVLKLND